MRTIDADVLKDIIEYRQMVEPKLSVYDVIKLIDNVPTVNIESCRECPFVEEKDKRIVINENATTVEITEEQAIDKLHETGWLPMHDKEMTERPTGEWLDEKFVAFHLTCNRCGCNIRREKTEVFEGDYNYNYCPNCGAKMIRTVFSTKGAKMKGENK